MLHREACGDRLKDQTILVKKELTKFEISPLNGVHIEADLKNENGQIVVSSRDVTVRFGKEHKNVIQGIEDMKK